MNNHDNYNALITQLTLTPTQLREIQTHVTLDIQNGLKQNGQQVKALPAFVTITPNAPEGEAVVLDAGGTNIRAANIRLDKGSAQFAHTPVLNKTLMTEAQAVGKISQTEFFKQQADLVRQVVDKKDFDLGYCFSFPSDNTPDGDARLSTWTKGVNIDNVVGQSLRKAISGALLNNGQTAHKVPVLNDTVTTALAAGWLSPQQDGYIGLIAGTGFNIAGLYHTNDISKLTEVQRAAWQQDKMVVNLELGNVHPPHLTQYDDELDAERVHDNPGKQRLEKAMAGHYIASLFGRMVGVDACKALPADLAFDPEQAHAGYVTQLRGKNTPVSAVAEALINRGADLTACALAGTIMSQNYPTQQDITVAILAEGSMFWRTEGYAQRVQQTLSSLIPHNIHLEILENTSAVDANFIGAACATLGMSA